MAAGKVNNAQTPMSQSNRTADKKSFVVWAAMNHAICHALELKMIHRDGIAVIENSSYATHMLVSRQPETRPIFRQGKHYEYL